MAPMSTQWNTLLTWITSSPMMPQSALDNQATVQSKHFFWKFVEESVAVICSFRPWRFRYQSCSRSHPPVWYRVGVRYRKQIRLLEWFHQPYLHFILGIRWQDYVSNEEVLKRASLPSMEFIFRCSLAELAMSQGWKTYTCPKQSSGISKKESMI